MAGWLAIEYMDGWIIDGHGTIQREQRRQHHSSVTENMGGWRGEVLGEARSTPTSTRCHDEPLTQRRRQRVLPTVSRLVGVLYFIYSQAFSS